VSELSDGVFIEAGENEEITGQPLKQHRCSPPAEEKLEGALAELRPRH